MTATNYITPGNRLENPPFVKLGFMDSERANYCKNNKHFTRTIWIKKRKPNNSDEQGSRDMYVQESTNCKKQHKMESSMTFLN